MSEIWEQPGWVVLAQDLSGRLQSSEGLAGAGRYASKIAHSCSFWQEASVPCYTDLSIRYRCCLTCLQDVEPGLPQSKGSKRTRWKLRCLTSQPSSMWIPGGRDDKGTSRGWLPHRGSLEALSEVFLANHYIFTLVFLFAPKRTSHFRNLQ